MDDDTATHANSPSATTVGDTAVGHLGTNEPPERPMRMPTDPHFHASDEPEIVRTPRVTYASIRGSGSPGTEEFYRK